ncbi:hypothetical protein ACOSQ3_010080 [Xanthoceras sorbifolium]
MIPDVFMNGGTVNVKGCQVAISVEAINEYYGLENNPLLTQYNKELAKDLRTSGKGTWFSNHAILKSEELHLDSAFWNEFCLYSLFPKSMQSMVSPDMAYVLYSIRHNLSINIGYLIRQEITAIGFNGESMYMQDMRLSYPHHRILTSTNITNWLPNDTSLNCWSMTLITHAEFDLG